MNDTLRRPPQPGIDEDVPVIPPWLREWGFIVLIVAAVIYLLIAAAAGRAYGAASGKALFAAPVAGTAVLLAADYMRRLESGRKRSDRALYERLEIAKIDAMDGREFEYYSADLFRGRHNARVERVADTKGQKQVDLIVKYRDKPRAAVECKHLASKLYPRDVDRLHGAINRDPYKGCRGILMTSAEATDGAKTAARDLGIELVDRPLLPQWISEARKNTEQRLAGEPAHRGLRAAVSTAAVLIVLPIIMALTLPPGTQPARAARAPARHPVAAAPGPALVLRDFYQAISQHNWPRVWQLGGKNLGRGPYATYNGMIDGYRGTERDVLQALTVNGDTASGWFLAYQTASIQRYKFRYVVRNGVIISGYQAIAAARDPGAGS